MSWWNALVEPVMAVIKEPVVEWQKRKTLTVENQEKEASRTFELNTKKADIAFELAKQGIKVDADWDTNAQNQMQYSWKDEWFTILFSIPLVMAFIPSMAEYILQGFVVLSQCPDWYMWLVIGIVSATFGLRWMFGKITIGRK